MKSIFSYLLKSFFLYTALTLFAAGCGTNNATTGNDTGAVAMKLAWSEGSGSSPLKKAAKAAAGVATVRIVVTGAGMSEIQRDFPAVDGGGMIDGVPSGGGRSITAQGLNSTGVVTHQGEMADITIHAGQTTDVGVIIMQMLMIPNPGTETEPNNSIDNATQIYIGGGTFLGRLSSAADADYYRFVSKGGAVEIQFIPEGTMTPDQAIRVSIIDRDKTTILASAIVSMSGPLAPTTLGTDTAPGNAYYLRIDKDPSNENAFTGYYVVTPEYSTDFYEFEPNDAIAEANRIILDSGATMGQLSGAEDADCFSFIPTGDAAELTAVFNGNMTSEESIRMSVLDESGATLDSKAITGLDNNAPVTLEIKTTAGSRYYLRFDTDPSALNSFTESYNLTLLTVPEIQQ